MLLNEPDSKTKTADESGNLYAWVATKDPEYKYGLQNWKVPPYPATLKNWAGQAMSAAHVPVAIQRKCLPLLKGKVFSELNL